MPYYLIVFVMLHGGGEGAGIKKYDNKEACLISKGKAADIYIGKTIVSAECYQAKD